MAKSVNENEDDVSVDIDDSLYYEDNFIYLSFQDSEAKEIIEPVEFVLDKNEGNDAKPAENESLSISKRKSLDLNDAIGRFFELTYRIGEETIELFKWIFSKLFIILIPFSFIFKKVKNVCKNIFNGLRNRQSFHNELKKMGSELMIIKEHSQELQHKHKTTKGGLLLKYFLLTFSRHKLFWKHIINAIFPIAAAVVLIVVASAYKSGSTYALEVIYNNKSLGYVESQDTFDAAKTTALSMISTDGEGGDNLIGMPTYKIRRVSVNMLCNSDMISQGILASSDVSYTRACAIYIDGEFLCAVRNESDAVAVFDSILEPYELRASKGTTVGFVEEISYVQGLFDSESGVIWDSIKLRNTLNEPKTTAKYHTVKKGETAKTIAKASGITISELKVLNPSATLNSLSKGSKLLVSSESDYVRVKTMKTRTRTESIAFDTVKKNSSSLTKGTTKVSQEGETGTLKITELVTYINGKISYTSQISSVQTKAPTDKIILVGTKETVYTTSSGSTIYSSNDNSGFIWPTYGAYSISSGFGYRSLRGYYSYHGGLDIVRGSGGSAGTPVIAAAAGTVVVAQSGYSGYGYTVLIDHGNGIRTRYGHMLAGSLRVSVGQYVSRGQQIGQIGSTGNSTGPHLHFEVLVNGSKVNPLNYIG